MPELPWIKWFPSDWASDPLLSMCDIATQGVWMNAVNAMYLINAPMISGTLDELCKPCRCRRTQLEAALAELRSKKVGNITERDGNIIIECRRIVRSHNIKELRRKAGFASAAQRQQTPQQTVPTPSASASAYASVSDSSSSKDRECEGKGNGVFERPSLEAIQLCAAKSELNPNEAEKFFNYYESNGWRVGKNRMKSWPHALANWKKNADERACLSKPRPEANEPNPTQIMAKLI